MRKLGIVLGGLLLVCLLNLEDKALAAARYPVKPITFIVPLEAGADGDIIVRPLCQKMSDILGKPLVIVNKPGAGNVIGNLEIYHAKPDGYVIGIGMAAMLTTKFTGASPVNYPDYTLLGTFYRMSAAVFGSTKTTRPFKTIEEVITFAKAHPGELSIASSAIGSSLWVAAMSFISGTGIKANLIPQPGAGSLAIIQVAGGHSDLAVTHLPTAKSQLDAGNIRFLAILGDERAPGYENIPLLKNVGYDISWDSFGFLVGPPKMPKDVTDRLINAFEVAANDPGYHKFLRDRFVDPFYLPTNRAIDYLDGKSKIMRDVMQKAGILKEGK